MLSESLTGPPFPHAEDCLLRHRVPGLPRQHRDLPAMMRVVCDQVAKESGHIRLEALHASIALQCALKDRMQSSMALRQCLLRLRRSHRVTIQLVRNFATLGRGLEPHKAYVVHVGHNACDLTALPFGRLGAPRLCGRLSMVYWLIRSLIANALSKAS